MRIHNPHLIFRAECVAPPTTASFSLECPGPRGFEVNNPAMGTSLPRPATLYYPSQQSPIHQQSRRDQCKGSQKNPIAAKAASGYLSLLSSERVKRCDKGLLFYPFVGIRVNSGEETKQRRLLRRERRDGTVGTVGAVGEMCSREVKHLLGTEYSAGILRMENVVVRMKSDEKIEDPKETENSNKTKKRMCLSRRELNHTLTPNIASNNHVTYRCGHPS
ncbi:hypothetical protein V8F06_005034 [Rhypophila decipiens]